MLFTDRPATIKRIMAIRISSAEKLNRPALTWCLLTGGWAVFVAVVLGCRFTVESGVSARGIPGWLLSRSVGVPDWTLPVWVPPTLPEPTADCGLWVVV